MAKYRVHEMVLVRVTSDVITAEDPIAAYEIYRKLTNLETLLRNACGTKMVAQVEFADERQKAVIDELDENDNFRRIADELDSEDLDLI